MGSDTSGLRQTITAAIAAAGWTPSRWGPELWGRDTDHLLHLAFVVAMPATEVDGRENRQRVSEGLLVRSRVEVHWAYRLRGDAQSGDYDAALDAEQGLTAAVRGIATEHVLVDGLTRKTDPAGWVLGTIRFVAVHRYALT